MEIRDVIDEYQRVFWNHRNNARNHDDFLPFFREFIVRAGFEGLLLGAYSGNDKKVGKWRHWDLYWPSTSRFELVGEFKLPGDHQFNPDLSKRGKQEGYIRTLEDGRPSYDQRGDGVAQLHLYCWELRVRYGLFSDGCRLLLYHHKEPFGEHCLDWCAEKCTFPHSWVADVQLLGRAPDLVAKDLTDAQCKISQR